MSWLLLSDAHTSKYLLLTHPYLLQEEYKMEVYHELIAEWKAKKLDVTSLFATVPISVIARAELERDGKEPESSPARSLKGY